MLKSADLHILLASLDAQVFIVCTLLKTLLICSCYFFTPSRERYNYISRDSIFLGELTSFSFFIMHIESANTSLVASFMEFKLSKSW